jgi:hypothetical protein
MPQQELLERIIQALDGLKIESMVTGSVTSSLQGEPRSTHDVDLVVDLSRDAADRLLGAFPPDEFHVSDQAIREALDRRTTFKLVDLVGGDKVDFWILTKVQHAVLDLDYVNEWAIRLGVESLWQRLRDESAPL